MRIVFSIAVMSLFLASGLARAGYDVVWVGPKLVKSVRVAATGDSATNGSHILGTTDMIFVTLQDETQPANPAGCAEADEYVFLPIAANTKENSMFALLLSAATAGLPVSVGISGSFCDSSHPTIYDVNVEYL